MTAPNPLPQSFYEADVVTVARRLLGQRLVRRIDGQRVGGVITEAEAYRGQQDLACHARAGLTPRTEVMFGPPGAAYVYFTYGMHWMLNIVCMEPGFPSAVLIRAIQPLEGLDIIAANRPKVPPERWTDGPAKLCQALQIDRAFNGRPVTTTASGLWIEPGDTVSGEHIISGPRVGLGATPEPWLSMPWRFRIKPVN